MNLSRISLSFRFGNAISLGFELFVSFTRIERFLLQENMPLNQLKYNPAPFDDVEDVKLLDKEKTQLVVSGVTCKLKENGNGERYLLRDVSFEANDKGLTVITGPVGSGKSTLLAAIAGEIIKSSGSVFCSGTIAYVPQTAWVFPGTLRENILFGEAYDEKKYTEVVEACALKEDINRFPNGDLSFVGEHGVVLSGGQRARVSLARAVYADAGVYLLDDPLSAVDSKVGEHIFEQCICRVLKEKIVILVTYSEKNMKEADKVVILHKGFVLGKGSFHEFHNERKFLDAVIDLSATTTEEQTRMSQAKKESYTTQSDFESFDDNFIERLEISEEDKAIGDIGSELYWDYFRAAMNPIAMIIVSTLFLASQG